MINYRRALCAFVSVAVALAALYFQVVIAGLSAGAALEFPATQGVAVVMLMGGPALAIVLLVCLFGGVKWSVLATGWMLVFQFLLCALVVLTLCDPVAGQGLWGPAALDRYPHALGAALGVVALGLSLTLVRCRGWGRQQTLRGATLC